MRRLVSCRAGSARPDTSWAAARGASHPAPGGVLAGILTYNAVGAVVLLFAGPVPGMVGVLPWPAVAYHVALAAWTGTGLRRPPGRTAVRAKARGR